MDVPNTPKKSETYVATLNLQTATEGERRGHGRGAGAASGGQGPKRRTCPGGRGDQEAGERRRQGAWEPCGPGTRHMVLRGGEGRARALERR